MVNGESIRQKRKKDGMNARELADYLDVKVENLYKWEKGHKPTDPEDYIKLEKWLSGKSESVPKKNTPVASLQPQGGQDYRDEVIALLKEKINSDGRIFAYAQTNQALLKTVVATLAKIQSKVDKRKLQEVQVEMNNLVSHQLDLLRKGDK